MQENKTIELKDTINYSIWCDFIERNFLENDFDNLITNKTIYGATSNPAIFEQAFTTSEAYKQQISMLQANEPKTIYEELAITDIKTAAQKLKPLYDQNSNDGFVSIEVDPALCDDAQATIEEGIRLHNQIGYENIMIKIPATKAGYEAMEYLTSVGISVNATLIFSPQQANLTAQALNNGIKKSAKDTKGVVSVFVSRFDRLLDTQLLSKNLEPSKVGIINATKCYYEVESINNPNIRTLFASTGVKSNTLPQSYYIDELIFPNSINTAPLNTIVAWLQNGSKQQSNILTLDECNQYFQQLQKANISLEYIYGKLLKDGLSAFKVSFQNLLKKVKYE